MVSPMVEFAHHRQLVDLAKANADLVIEVGALLVPLKAADCGLVVEPERQDLFSQLAVVLCELRGYCHPSIFYPL